MKYIIYNDKNVIIDTGIVNKSTEIILADGLIYKTFNSELELNKYIKENNLRTTLEVRLNELD